MKDHPLTGLLASLLVSLLALGAAAGCGRLSPDAVVLATTTSVEDSGLLGHLVRAYRADGTDAPIRSLAVGSGEALELGRRGDADLLVVHHPSEEQDFVTSGYGEERRPIMYNDFVIVGPPTDPAGVAEAASAPEALRAVAAARATFLSRGDDSGTHASERQVWTVAAVIPEQPWYVETGQGMGALLQMTSELGAYTLTDRATFYAMKPRLQLEILHEGDPTLRNVYSVILVTGSRSGGSARRLWSWLTGPEGRQAIEGFRDAQGQPLFHPVSAGDAAWELATRPSGEDQWGVGPSPSAPVDTRQRAQLEGIMRGGVTRADRTAEAGRWSTLRQRFLCRSVPPAQSDPSCG